MSLNLNLNSAMKISHLLTKHLGLYLANRLMDLLLLAKHHHSYLIMLIREKLKKIKSMSILRGRKPQSIKSKSQYMRKRIMIKRGQSHSKIPKMIL